MKIAALTFTLVLFVAACGKSNDKPIETGAAPTTKGDATTTSAPPPPVYPLTGMPLDDPAAAQHPAVVVKMDNSPDARPQTGINEADVVYELLVEGITRYALVYQSQTPDEVGPVRSARSSDIELLANLGAPLIAWSGANPGVTNEVRAAVDGGFLVNAGQDAIPGQYHRDNSRKAPHNLYTNVAGLLTDATPEGAGAPPALFSYRPVGQPYTGGSLPAGGYVVDFGGGVRADYVWDAERGGWDRFQVDERHSRDDSATLDGNGVQVAPQNVVILFLEYGQSPSDARSPMALSTGEGDAVVLTDGKAIEGRWKRPNPLSAWELVDQSGQPIALTPGRTWVALPEIGSAATAMDADAAGSLLALRR
jgi:hypothetical protein